MSNQAWGEANGMEMCGGLTEEEYNALSEQEKEKFNNDDSCETCENYDVCPGAIKDCTLDDPKECETCPDKLKCPLCIANCEVCEVKETCPDCDAICNLCPIIDTCTKEGRSWNLIEGCTEKEIHSIIEEMKNGNVLE